jgi:hypothetical protein
MRSVALTLLHVATQQGPGPGGPRGRRINVTKFACGVVDGDAGEFPSAGLVQEGAVGQRGGMWLLLLVL